MIVSVLLLGRDHCLRRVSSLIVTYSALSISCLIVEVSRKEIDIITMPDGSDILVHEPRAKVDLTKYLDHHNFKLVTS